MTRTSLIFDRRTQQDAPCFLFPILTRRAQEEPHFFRAIDARFLRTQSRGRLKRPSATAHTRPLSGTGHAGAEVPRLTLCQNKFEAVDSCFVALVMSSSVLFFIYILGTLPKPSRTASFFRRVYNPQGRSKPRQTTPSATEHQSTSHVLWHVVRLVES